MIPDGVFFTRSTDGGATFEPALRLDTGVGGIDVAASGNNVYVVWLGGETLSYPRSTDAGDTFEPIENLTQPTQTGHGPPKVSASGNNVYVVGFNYIVGHSGVFFKRSTDNGANFKPTVGFGAGSRISIAATGNSAYLVWNSGSLMPPPETDVLFTRSTDGGATFGAIQNLSTDAGGGAGSPYVAGADGRVYVVWSSSGVFFKESTDGGATFGPTSNPTTEGTEPSVATSP